MRAEAGRTQEREVQVNGAEFQRDGAAWVVVDLGANAHAVDLHQPLATLPPGGHSARDGRQLASQASAGAVVGLAAEEAIAVEAVDHRVVTQHGQRRLLGRATAHRVIEQGQAVGGQLLQGIDLGSSG
ncbi:hypothetical protein D3C81_1775840 [compost metagenome]